MSPLWRSLPMDLLAAQPRVGDSAWLEFMNIAAIHDQGLRCGPDPLEVSGAMYDYFDWLSPRWNIKWSQDYITQLTGSGELSDPTFPTTYARLAASASEVDLWVGRRGLAGGSAALFRGNSQNLRVIDAVKVFAWGLIANALPFAARTRWRRAVPGDYHEDCCPLCLQQGVDSKEHFLRECSTTQRLWSRFPATSPGSYHPGTLAWEKLHSPGTLIPTTTFWYSVWVLRGKVAKGASSRTFEGQLGEVGDIFSQTMAANHRRKTGFDPEKFRVTIGRCPSRKQLEALRQDPAGALPVARFPSLADKVYAASPQQAPEAVCYTDGSTLNNPGPAGAAALLVLPGGARWQIGGLG